MCSLGFVEVVVIAVAVFYLILLIPALCCVVAGHGALGRCALESRTMPPGKVWLTLVPFFNFVWIFIVVDKVASSLRNEFLRRRLPLAEAEPGKTLGTAACALSLASFVPLLGLFAHVAAVVCWILYYSRITGYSRQIASPAV